MPARRRPWQQKNKTAWQRAVPITVIIITIIIIVIASKHQPDQPSCLPGVGRRIAPNSI